MKILIATGIYPPDVGGPATYSKLLNDELPKRGFTVEVLSFGEVRHLPKVMRHISYFLKVLRKGRSTDIIYAQDPVSVGLPVCLASFLLRKKFILKVVGDYAWEQFQVQKAKTIKQDKLITPDEFQNMPFDWLTELRRAIERGVARRAEKVIVPSKYLKTIIKKWGVKEEKITVIYNAFTPVAIPEGKDELRSKLGFKGPVLFSSGRFVPWKGFKALIEIMKDMPEYKLFIAGDGPEAWALKTTIANYSLQERVVLLGSLRQDKLFEYIKAADVFVLNTGYEGLSHQLLEVMSIGTPIVTTKVCGNPELMENDKEGILVSYNDKDALAKAINSVLAGENFSENAQKKVRQFSKEKMLTEIIKILS